jgi:hypothetical protein
MQDNGRRQHGGRAHFLISNLFSKRRSINDHDSNGVANEMLADAFAQLVSRFSHIVTNHACILDLAQPSTMAQLKFVAGKRT